MWYNYLLEVIDLRSFSNLWFWIALAVVWSSASHWVLGVPYDLVLRARRKGGQAAEDVADLVRIFGNRLMYISNLSGMWLVGFSGFMVCLIGMLGFWYGLQFFQAVFLIVFPLSIVGLLSVRQVRRIRARELEGEALYRALARHRFGIQVIGLVSIFVTALWGMYQNLTASVLGG